MSDIKLLTKCSGDPSAICIISGTGSIAWWEPEATDQQSLSAVIRAGGFGQAVGDEGSGFWIAQESVRAVCQAEDGRGE